MTQNCSESCVLVLRESHRARRTEASLRGRGYTPLCVPLFLCHVYDSSIPDAWVQSLETDIFVLTSASTLRSESVQYLLHERPHMPVFAVGDYTAEKAREFGLKTVISAGGDRYDLLSHIQKHYEVPARLLFATGRHHKHDFPLQLSALGYEVTVWEVYNMEAVTTLPGVLLEIFSKNYRGAILHYSRRSTEVFCDLMKAAGLFPLASSCCHFCISQDAAEPLFSLSVPSVVVADTPTESALLSCLRGL